VDHCDCIFDPRVHALIVFNDAATCMIAQACAEDPQLLEACANPRMPPMWKVPAQVRNDMPMRSSIPVVMLTVRRRCLVCDVEEELEERLGTDEIGPPCIECHAPTERIAILQRGTREARNPHAAALGRLGGLKGGPARAATLTPERRKEIARRAARRRWGLDD
jgi:hypothetical protein